jgi:hypothetical protein
MRAIKRMLTSTIEVQVHPDFAPEGLRCVIDAPLGEGLGKRR